MNTQFFYMYVYVYVYEIGMQQGQEIHKKSTNEQKSAKVTPIFTEYYVYAYSINVAIEISRKIAWVGTCRRHGQRRRNKKEERRRERKKKS